MTAAPGAERTEGSGTPDGRPARALAWSLANTAASRFGTLAIGVVLARVLGPEEFGTFAVAFVALLAVLSFNELGVSLAIVRWPGDPAAIAPTVATLSCASSLVLTACLVGVAPSFAAAMGDPDAASLVQLLSLCVLVNGVVATPAALLQRAFRQDLRTVADQANVWVGAIGSVLLALLGMGALSLVVGRLAGSLVSAAVLLRCSPLPLRWGLDREVARRLLSFGLPLAGASAIVFVGGFVDQLIVGHLLGPVVLGFYVLAANLASWPASMFSQPLRSVAPALFARLQHDPVVMRESLSRVLRPLAAAALPACAMLAVTAEDLVRVVYGNAWTPAGSLLRWLAVAAAGRILAELAYDYLVVRGRSGAVLRLHLLSAAVLVPVLWWAAEGRGAEAAAAAVALVAAGVSLPAHVWALRRSGVLVGPLLRAATVPLAAAGGAAALGAVVLHLAAGDLVGLLLCGVLGAAVAAAVLAWARADLAVLRLDPSISER